MVRGLWRVLVGTDKGRFGKEHRLSRRDRRAKNRLFGEEHADRVHQAPEALRPIAESLGITLGQLAPPRVIAQPRTCAIAGARNEEQILESAKAGEVRLTAPDLARMDEIGRRVTDPLDKDPVLWEF